MLILIFLIGVSLLISYFKDKIDKYQSENYPEKYFKRTMKRESFLSFVTRMFRDIEEDTLVGPDEDICLKETILEYCEKYIDVFKEEVFLENYYSYLCNYDNLKKSFFKLSKYDLKENSLLIGEPTGFNFINSRYHENTKYNKRRNVSLYSFDLYKDCLKKRKSEINKELKVNFETFCLFFDDLKKNAIKYSMKKWNNYCFDLNDFKTSKEDVILISNLLNNSEFNKLIFVIKEFVISPDIYFILENYYELIETNLNDSIVRNIRFERGDITELVVGNIIYSLNPNFMTRSLVIDDREIDFIVEFDEYVIICEVKSIDYNLKHFTYKDSRDNIKKYLKKGVKQLHLNMENIKKRDELKFTNGKKLELKNKKIIPLLITSNDMYDFINFSDSEAEKFGYVFNPLMVSLDDFKFIVNYKKQSCPEYLNLIYTQRKKDYSIKDEIYQLFYNEKMDIFRITLRNSISFRRLYDIVYSCEVKKMEVHEFYNNLVKNLKPFPMYKRIIEGHAYQFKGFNSIEDIYNSRLTAPNFFVYFYKNQSFKEGIGIHLFFDENDELIDVKNNARVHLI